MSIIAKMPNVQVTVNKLINLEESAARAAQSMALEGFEVPAEMRAEAAREVAAQIKDGRFELEKRQVEAFVDDSE